MLNESLLQKILSEDKLKVLKEFLNDYINDPNVIGILLTGSHVHGDAGKHADVNLHIVLNESKTRTRGNIFIRNYEIEYFINPIVQIEKYFEEDFPKNNHPAHMFANSIFLYENGSELKQLKVLANSFFMKELPDLTEYDIYLCRYILDDARKDLLDALDLNDQYTFELVANDLVKDIIHYFGRIRKIYPAKAKRLDNQLMVIDQNFAQKLKNYLLCSADLQSKFILLDECIAYIESLVGGSRPSIYAYTGPLSIDCYKGIKLLT